MRFSTCQINDQPVVLGWISGRVFWKPWKIDLDKLLAVFTMDVLTKGLFPSLLGLSDDSFGEVVEKQFISIFKWQDGWMEYQKTIAFLFVFLFVVSFHSGFSFLSFFFWGGGRGWLFFWGDVTRKGVLNGRRQSTQSTWTKWLWNSSWTTSRHSGWGLKVGEEVKAPDFRFVIFHLKVSDFWWIIDTFGAMNGRLWSDHPQFSWAKASDPNMIIYIDDMNNLGCNYSLPFEKNILSFAQFLKIRFLCQFRQQISR